MVKQKLFEYLFKYYKHPICVFNGDFIQPSYCNKRAESLYQGIFVEFFNRNVLTAENLEHIRSKTSGLGV